MNWVRPSFARRTCRIAVADPASSSRRFIPLDVFSGSQRHQDRLFDSHAHSPHVRSHSRGSHYGRMHGGWLHPGKRRANCHGQGRCGDCILDVRMYRQMMDANREFRVACTWIRDVFTTERKQSNCPFDYSALSLYSARSLLHALLISVEYRLALARVPVSMFVIVFVLRPMIVTVTRSLSWLS